jgi:DNA-binding response OmpR family regulator
MEEKLQLKAGLVPEAVSVFHSMEKKEKVKILLTEDDDNLAFLIKDNLETAGYEILWVKNGEEGLLLSQNEKIDLFILDIMMPKRDGFWLAEQIRKRDYETPIIFLTAKNSERDKIEGFTLGADDFITKPFSIKELLLRMTAILKRTKTSREKNERDVTIGKITFNYMNRYIKYENEVKRLNIKEAELLKMLIESKNTIVQRRTLLMKIWGSDDYFLSRSMDVYITRLRKLLTLDPYLVIQNIYGTGFKLVERKADGSW